METDERHILLLNLLIAQIFSEHHAVDEAQTLQRRGK
jgi:hypothetical protein